jgi:hypothetical protein
MAGTALSIKLRCTSWQQLATIYRRDLSRGTMFLKASNQPPIGTIVRIDLELPSATVLELTGTITDHSVDPQRGTGVTLKLEPLPTKTVWLIESALAAGNKVRAQTAAGDAATPGDSTVAITEGENIAEAESELVRALEAEAESLKKLNPFLVLGVGYETTDADVRAAFGELTKRYHPDRFARYQSTNLRQIAAEIFILIRDAYRKLADEASRAQVRATLGAKAVQVPTRAQTPPRGTPRIATQQVPKVPRASSEPRPDAPVLHGPHDAPTNPSSASAAIASTQLAKASDVPAVHVIERPSGNVKSGPVRGPALTTPISPSDKFPMQDPNPRRPTTQPTAIVAEDASGLEMLIDEGKLDEALAGYRVLVKKNSQDRSARAGVELVEGLRSLAARDRLEAAQRFESALEIDPSNERAARELADMRRQATNERKGLLSRLMGKKEGPG